MKPSDQPPVDGQTFADALAATVSTGGDHDALVFPALGYRRSYGQLQAEVRETARALLALGVHPGEHVGIWATNCPEWVVTQLAAAQMGAVLVNINPAYRANELQYVLNQADITTLLLTDQFKTSQYFDLLAEVCPEMNTASPGEVRSAACPALRRVVSLKAAKRPGMLNWDEFRAGAGRVSDAELEHVQRQTRSEDVVNIQYTSGTTGFPKGAMLTHRNLLLNGWYIGERLACTAQDRICIPVPLYHCFGCVCGVLTCLARGAAMVFPAESFDPLATLQAIQQERCTAVYGVPTMFIAQLHHPRFAEFDLRSLRTGMMAGSPCPIEIMRAVVERMGAREMTIGYGLTEASPIITQTATTDSLEQRVGTVGTRLPGLEVRIVTPGTCDPLPPNQSGELMVRGHCVMKGYYKKLEETAAAITPDGWLHSGDLALETTDGYFRITGRIKDLIIRGGENISPREIEELLYTHPMIADVQVVGLPDERFGEEISAWVRLKPDAVLTEDEVRCHCRAKLAHFKTPRYVAFVSEYPTTVTGKIQKYKLRQLGIERFGLQRAAATETA